MSNVKFKLNRQGVRELLRSEEMMTVCRSHADAARSRLGEGYEVTTYTGKKPRQRLGVCRHSGGQA